MAERVDDNVEDADERAEPADKDDYEVGYRKPPREHQFKPGQSGNPKGRKKGSRGLKAELDDALGRKVPIKIDGKVEKGTTLRQTMTTLALRAANGDLKAQALLIPLVLQVFGTEDRGTDRGRLSVQDQTILDDLLSDAHAPAILGDPEPEGEPEPIDEGGEEPAAEPESPEAVRGNGADVDPDVDDDAHESWRDDDGDGDSVYD